MKDKVFIQELLDNHVKPHRIPSKSLLETYLNNLLSLLFPARNTHPLGSMDEILQNIASSTEQFIELIKPIYPNPTQAQALAIQFYKAIPQIYQSLKWDAESIEKGDPAANSLEEVLVSYPGFLAVAVYRLAHVLYTLDLPLLPRMLTEYAHSQTGIDIHPGASIGNSFCIDHGTGVVIGETTVIGNNVKIYQGVTLGALSVSKNLAKTKRHPTIENDVIIYAGATILGGNCTIGHNSIVGGNVWLTQSVPPYSRVYHKAQITIENSPQ
jgi:serine O-acetyltransferase